MNLKKCLIAATVALGAASSPAFAGVDVSIGIGVPIAPPAVIYEPVPPPPAVGYVWIPGYWGWHADRYIWIRGRYAYGRPGYTWAPDRWQQRGPNWHHVDGRWERGGRAPHGRAYGHGGR